MILLNEYLNVFQIIQVQALGSVKGLETILLFWRYINKIELTHGKLVHYNHCVSEMFVNFPYIYAFIVVVIIVYFMCHKHEQLWPCSGCLVIAPFHCLLCLHGTLPKP